MTSPDLSIVLAVGRAGRAALPTMRSVRDSRGLGAFEVLVVCSDADEAAVRGVLEGAGIDARVIVSPERSRAAQRNAGLAAARGGVIAVLDAGDLISDGWLAAARDTVSGGSADLVAHPETVVTFGRRSGWWQQPEHDAGAVLLPVAAAWGSAVVARRDTWDRVPYPEAHDEVLDAAWQAAGVGASVRHVTVAGTLVFSRVWTDVAPWESHTALLPRVPFLSSESFAASVAPPRPGPRRSRDFTVRGLPVGRAVRAVAAPWVRGVRRVTRSRTARFPEDVRAAWLAANRLEPLVPYPRADVARWYERVDPAGPIEQAARGYWWTIARLGSTVDYLFFAPWVRTGGGDAVLRQYVAAVERLDPGARTALITTEPEPSPQLSGMPAHVRVAEYRQLLAAGLHRDDLVQSIVPALLAQLAPHTVHAFNSTVAFDVVEQHGPRLPSALFLTTFAIDRSADGERLSVLFLRRPGFLDPVRAVLVDSEQFVDTAVRELGYPREKFAVQRSVIEPVDRPQPSSAGVPLRVFWAGRFDLPKRIDILAQVVRHARSVGFPLEMHYYGLEVMGTPGLAASLAELDELGAIRHPPYSRFGDLPLTEFDAYVLTSEWEGVPLTVLEAMTAGVPVVAPLVGGVGEVLTAETGYPVSAFDDPAAYVVAFASLAEDFPEALRRAAAARETVRRRFSVDAFDAVLRAVDGYLRDA